MDFFADQYGLFLSFREFRLKNKFEAKILIIL